MDEALLKRTDVDFLRRSFMGIIVYMAIWPALAWFSGFWKEAPGFNLGFTLAFVGIGVLRILQAYGHEFYYDRRPKLTRFFMLAFSYCHAITLSALLVMVTLTPEYQHMMITTLMVNIGISSGSAASLSTKPTFTKLYLCTLIIPGGISCMMVPELQYLLSVYITLLLYFIMVAHRYYREYIRAYNIEKELKDKQIELERLNITDTLTGLYNRQYFDNALDMQWSQASRSQSRISILFLDLDFFKKVNDVYGHLAGDTALIHAAKIFKDIAKRKSDMVARYGGEEFAIILPGNSFHEAYQLAENIRKAIEQSSVQHGENIITIRVSIGVNSTIPTYQSSVTDFLDQADQALYQAKEQGRNRVVCFDDSKADTPNK